LSLEMLQSHPVDMDELGVDADQLLTFPDYSTPAAKAFYRNHLLANVRKAEGVLRYLDEHFNHVPRVGYGRLGEENDWYPVW